MRSKPTMASWQVFQVYHPELLCSGHEKPRESRAVQLAVSPVQGTTKAHLVPLGARSSFPSTRGRTRTRNPRFRRPMLYPIELRALRPARYGRRQLASNDGAIRRRWARAVIKAHRPLSLCSPRACCGGPVADGALSSGCAGPAAWVSRGGGSVRTAGSRSRAVP